MGIEFGRQSGYFFNKKDTSLSYTYFNPPYSFNILILDSRGCYRLQLKDCHLR